MAAGASFLAAAKANADIAGQTKTAADAPPAEQAMPAGPPLTDLWDGAVGDLGPLLAGGVHPETFLQVLPSNSDLERATDSLRGKVGGLVARAGSVTQPGPAGGAHAARAIVGKLPATVAEMLRKTKTKTKA